MAKDDIKSFEFTKGKSGNPNGRPRKLISHVNKELQIEGFEEAKIVDIKAAYLTLLNLPISKIKEISEVSNDDYPILYKLIAKEILGKRGAEMLEKILDRAIGRSKQQMDITSGGDKIDIPVIQWVK